MPSIKPADPSGAETQQPREVVRYTFPAHSGPPRSVKFVKALVLSHPAATERRQSILKNFARFKLPPISFVDAVDVKDVKAGCHTVPDTRPGKPEGWLTFNKECMEQRMAFGVDLLAADKMPHGHVALTATYIQAIRQVAEDASLAPRAAALRTMELCNGTVRLRALRYGFEF